MALRNADKDVSEQRDVYTWSSQGQVYGLGATFATLTGPVSSVPTGQTLFLAGPMPYPYVLQSVNALCVGSSGAPQMVISILRPIPSAAMTAIIVSISNMVICQGASFLGFGASAVGYLGYSGLAATGSTLLLGQRGDLIVASTAVANTASLQLMVNIVVQKVQDVVKMDGV